MTWYSPKRSIYNLIKKTWYSPKRSNNQPRISRKKKPSSDFEILELTSETYKVVERILKPRWSKIYQSLNSSDRHGFVTLSSKSGTVQTTRTGRVEVIIDEEMEKDRTLYAGALNDTQTRMAFRLFYDAPNISTLNKLISIFNLHPESL